MAERVDIFFKSRDGVTQLHATEWLPEERPPKAILQITHGMKEYIDRYDGFARYIADRGFIVVGEDHLGHGRTVLSNKELGYFTKKDSDVIIIKDMHRLKKMVQSEHPGLPYFFYGFSMGSYMLRKYLTMYGEGIDGAIIAGTGWESKSALTAGLSVASIIGWVHGDRYRSRFLESMIFKSYNDRIPKKISENDWLTTDKEIVSKYNNDSFCTFRFTVNAYKTLFKLIKYDEKAENIRRIPHNLPVMFMAGIEDPVGNYGEGVKQTARFFMVNGMKNVAIKLYEGMRHEIHNERRKHVVYLDILEWLESLM